MLPSEAEVHAAIRNKAETLGPELRALIKWRLAWLASARKKQLTPKGDDWFYWNLRCGRGWGKTRTGAEDLGYYAATTPGARCVVVGATFDDVRSVCFEGESGLLNVIPDELIRRKGWNKNILELRLANGSLIVGKSAERPDRLRGPQFHRAWCDELASWGGGRGEGVKSKNKQGKQSILEETWSNLMFGLRLGDAPKCVITSTPRPLAFLKKLEANPRTITTLGTTFENKANLAAATLQLLADTYGGTRRGRQELDAELLEEIEGALWKLARIEALRVRDMPELIRIIVAIDPAVTANADSDETGIIVAGVADNGHVYILADLSGVYAPHEWAKVALGAYESFEADLIVGETNNGGDLIEANLRAWNEGLYFGYKGINVRRGKYLRAEPVAALTEKGRIHHVGRLAKLEEQMTKWTGEADGYSPDRLDAMVIATTELTLGNSKHAFF